MNRRQAGPQDLIERDSELAALKQSLAAARHGAGGIVFIEAFGGTGKTCLLTAAGELARQARMLVLRGAGNQLESGFAFGLARQLLEPLWLSRSPSQRRALVSGPARPALRILSPRSSQKLPATRDERYAVIHGLYWLVLHLAASQPGASASRPVVILVDDAHWADAPSLRFLAYLSQRTADLRLALVVAAGRHEPSTDARALASLRSSARQALLQPGSLSAAGVAQMARKQYRKADDLFCALCARVTAGNPFLVSELLAKLGEDELEPTATVLEDLAAVLPERVRERVSLRLSVMPVTARKVARAVSVFPDGASVRQAASVAGIGPDAALQAADTLAQVGFLQPGLPLVFVHPLVRAAVMTALSELERTRAHRRAASVLAEERADPEEIAAHLLLAPPAADPAVVEALRIGAEKALTEERPDDAVRLLRRALAEPASSRLQTDLLSDLGQAELAAGQWDGVEHLEQARRTTEHPERRAELALLQGRALYARRRFAEAAAVLDGGPAELEISDTPLARELTATYVAAASLVPELRDRALALRGRVAGVPDAEISPIQRVAIAHTAVYDALTGAPRRQIRELAQRAWTALDAFSDGPADVLTWPLLSVALLLCDEVEFALGICEAVIAGGPAARPPSELGLVNCCRAWGLYEQGRVAEAQAEAQAVLEAELDPQQICAPPAMAIMVLCHLERGHLDEAEVVLGALDRAAQAQACGPPLALELRARLLLAQHRPREALRELSRAQDELRSRFPLASAAVIPWRSTAALAHLALGEPEPARALAEEELADARRIGTTRGEIRNLRILGLARPNGSGLHLLTEATEVGDASAPRLERVKALVELGAALRRVNRRVDARAPLLRALELSHAGGASELATQAQTELVAAGARPRRTELSGTGSLTVSQQRVAELAARGLTTREIAEVLFVSPKTVEFHLRHVYRKLDVGSRDQLAQALSSK